MKPDNKISIFKEKIEINYWLWALITIPWGIYGLFQPYPHPGDWLAYPHLGDWIVSDYDYIKDWAHNYGIWIYHGIDGEFVNVVLFALFRAFALPYIVGFLGQFLIMFLRLLVQRKLIQLPSADCQSG
jgi:hypothetical protein